MYKNNLILEDNAYDRRSTGIYKVCLIFNNIPLHYSRRYASRKNMCISISKVGIISGFTEELKKIL